MDPSSHPAFASLAHSRIDTPCGSEVACWHTKSEDMKAELPVMLLIHGYPESSYMWRHVLPSFKAKFNVFVADLPGYGLSTPSQQDSSRHTIGHSILHALTTALPSHKRVVLLGHDRGARTVQRLAVTTAAQHYPQLQLLAAIMVDIVPYVAQWHAFANPRASTGYFHWPFLAVSQFSTAMIQAYGGGKFCKDLLGHGAGQETRARFEAEDAFAHYASHFDKESVLRAAAADYEAGASLDYDAQIEDQKQGRKLAVPSLVIFAEAKLGKMHDVPEVWKDWVSPGTRLVCQGVGEGTGHYIPEEVPERTVQIVMDFLRSEVKL